MFFMRIYKYNNLKTAKWLTCAFKDNNPIAEENFT